MARRVGRGEFEVDQLEGSAAFRRRLASIGYSNLAVDAVWPEWWGPDAEDSLSARAELRISVSRRLGLLPSSVFGSDDAIFVWKDAARFKNLGASSELEQAILSSFATSLAGILIGASPEPGLAPHEPTAGHLRDFLSSLGGFGLLELIEISWGLGIPVVKTRVFPLAQKRMHAVASTKNGRFAIILGESTRFPAKAAFSVAHELGHILLGHIAESRTLLDVEDVSRAGGDGEEEAANAFALELLTGQAAPTYAPSATDYNAPTLASAAQSLGAKHGIDPGIVVLTYARQTGDWSRGTAALKLLGEQDVEGHINRAARSLIVWEEVSPDDRSYLDRVLGGAS